MVDSLVVQLVTLYFSLYSRVMQFNDDRYCGTLLDSVIDSEGFPTTRKVSRVVRFVYLFRQIRQRYQMFDASKYVLEPYF